MSQNNVDISIKTAVDGQKELTEYQKELIKLGRSSQEVDAQVDILSETLSDLAKATELKEKLSETSEELETTTDNLEKARDAFKRASEEALQFSKSADPKSVKEMNKVLADQEKEIKKLEQAQLKAQKKYADTNKAVDQSSDSIKELISNTDKYNESIQKVENAQEKLNAELKNLNEIGDAYSKLDVHDLEKEIEDLESAYKTLEESGKLSADELRQAHEKLTEEVNRHKKALNGTDQAYKDLKTGAIHFLPVAAAFTAITKSAISYEDKMADVKKVITATDEEFKELSKSLIEMSKATPVSAAGLAEIAAAGAQLGVEVGNLKEFVTITADMATAFDMTAEDAGKAVASLSNIFGITINATKELGDAINHLSNNSASNARQIVDVLVRIGGTGKAIGLTQQEVAALGSTLISFGNSPEIAGTALDAFLSRLQILGSLGPNAQESLKKMGVSAVEMSQMISQDASEAVVYFLEQVSKLDDTAKAGVLTNIFGAGPRANILLMANNVEQLKSQLDLVGDSAKYFGSMQDEATARAATTAAQIEILKNNITALAIDLGSKLLPTLNETIKSFSSIAQGIGAFAEANPAITGLIVKLVVVASTAKMLSGAMSLVGIKGGEAFSKLNTGIQATSVSMSSFVARSVAEIPLVTLALDKATVGAKNLATTISTQMPIATKAISATAKGVSSLNNWFSQSSGAAASAARGISSITVQLWALNTAIEALESFNEQMRASEALKKAEARAEEIANEARKVRLKRIDDEIKSIKDGTKAQKEKSKVDEEEARQIAILNESLEKLGLSYNQIELGLTKAGEAAIDTFNQVGNHAKATSQIINQSFGAALNEVSTPQEFLALMQSFKDLGEQGKITATDMVNYKVQIDELYKSVRLGIITDAEFAEKKKEISGIIAEQVNGFSALNHEISKQVQLINTQIALDKKLVDSVIRKLEAEKEIAKAMNDTVKVQEIERQIQATRIAGMKDEAKAVAKLVEEYKKELLVLQAREANGQALTEAEQQRVRALKAEIEARSNEIEAINKSADAKELDIAMSYKNASALDGLAKSANNAASAQQSVASAVSKAGDASEKTAQKGGGTTSWLRGMADESKKSASAVKELNNAMNELNYAMLLDGTTGGGWFNTEIATRKFAAIQNNIAYQIKKSEELEKQIGVGASQGIDAIEAMQETVKELGYVNKEVTDSMTENLKQLANEAKNTYAEIDRESADLMNTLVTTRNQNEMHQLRMKQINERAALESKILQAQEDGDSVREKKLRDQMRLLQEVQNQQQRVARDERQAQERNKNQKIDVNLNGTNLKNLDPNNPADMDKLAQAVVVKIVDSKNRSTRGVIKQNSKR